MIVGTFSGLSDTAGPSFGRRVVILETLAKYRSCVVMLDLECDDLVNEMFSTFFAVVRFVLFRYLFIYMLFLGKCLYLGCHLLITILLFTRVLYCLRHVCFNEW